MRFPRAAALSCALVVTAAAALSGTNGGAPASGGAPALATALADRARAALDAGRWADACGVWLEYLRLDLQPQARALAPRLPDAAVIDACLAAWDRGAERDALAFAALLAARPARPADAALLQAARDHAQRRYGAAVEGFGKARALGCRHPSLDARARLAAVHRQYERFADVPAGLNVFLVVLLLASSVILHEMAHAWAAWRMGDPTAYEAGRLSPNPLVHVDLFGTLLVPLVTALVGGFFFGWAKPVPVDPRNFRHPRAGDLVTTLAGPAANFFLFAFFALLWHLGDAERVFFRYFCLLGAQVNFVLALINLLPIPPLDGSALVRALLPPAAAARYMSIGIYGFLLVFVALNLRPVQVFFGAAWTAAARLAGFV